MKSLLLKLFSAETLITIVIDLLAASVKNPESAKSKQLHSIVLKLNRATSEFLSKVF